MKVKDSAKLSVNSILHRRLRAWLTLLGIVIGVAAVVSILALSSGTQASVSSSFSGFGADILTVTAGFNRAGGFGGGIRGGPDIGGFGGGGGGNTGRATSTTTVTPVLTDNDIAVIKSNSDVVAVNQIVSGRLAMKFGAQQTNASIQGVNANTWMKTNNVTLASGRSINSSDTRSVVIGNSLANGKVFTQPITLGRKIDLNGTSFTVVGILAASGSSFGGGSDSTIFMPYNVAWDIVDVNRGNYSSLQVKVSDPTNVALDANVITSQLIISRRVTATTQNFTVTSSQAIQQQISSVMQTLTLFLAAIAAVSLIVGAVGVANSMFTSVLEKTKEIGIMKALGATNNEVLTLFIIESGLFGLIGGIIGVGIAFALEIILDALGIGLSLGFTRGTSIMVISPELVIMAILLSTMIGIISGLMPARNASKMRPVDALKYE